MAKRAMPSVSRMPDVYDYGDDRITYRLYPETAEMFGECLLFFIRHHPDHPWATTMKDWAKVMRPSRRKRRKG